jgi:hypothetical protein
MKLHFITYTNNQILHPPTKPQIIDPMPAINTTINTISRFGGHNMINSIQNGGKCLACNKY